MGNLLETSTLQQILIVITLLGCTLLVWYIFRLRRGTLERQLLTAFILIAMLSLIPVTLIGIWLLQITTTQQAGQLFTTMAVANSRRLGEELQRELNALQLLSSEQVIFDRITATSETELAILSPLARIELLQEREKAWQQRPFADTLTNSASQRIAAFNDAHLMHSQIMIIDRYGGLVAATGFPPTHYYYANQPWWQPIQSIMAPQTIAIEPAPNTTTALTQQLRVTQLIQPQFTTVVRGVLQSYINLPQLESLSDATLPENGGEIAIVGANGNILYSSNPDRLTNGVNTITNWQTLDNHQTNWGRRTDENGESVIYSITPLILSAPNTNLSNLNLHIYIQQNYDQALANVRRLTNIALMGGLLAITMAFTAANIITRRLVRPIATLTDATTAIANGDLTRTVTPSGPEELLQLAYAFNEMTRRLNQTLIDLEWEIGERQQIEEQLKKYTAELERSNRELQDFAYAASHDLQEPLRKIQAFGGRLQNKYATQLDERGLDYLNRMIDASDRMQTLIINLLAYSRITTKAQPFEPVNLNQLVQDVLRDLEVRIAEVQATISVDPLPAIEADPTQMRQLFQNLLSNALKFHHPDVSPIIHITAVSNPTTNSCHIQIADNGIGFDPIYAERIFALFQRLHGRTEYAGTGIGLAVCRKIVERHQGTITAAGRPQAGATFTITLPIQQTSPANRQPLDPPK
jgi:signal transduction histidine kinase